MRTGRFAVVLVAGVVPWAFAGCSSGGEGAQGTAGAGGTLPAGCLPGYVDCGGFCVSTLDNLQHCGGCNLACGVGQACVAGSCQCQEALTPCAAGCADLATDGANCGACGAPCAPGLFCSQGACVSSCAMNETVCGQSCVDTSNSVLHCGGCSQPCAAGQSCSAGSCACPTGTLACAGLCVDPLTDSAHCGGCGVACAAGQSCVTGACQGGGTGGTGGADATGGGGATGGGPTGGTQGGGTGGATGGIAGTGGDATGGGGTPTGGGGTTSNIPQCSAGDAMPPNPNLPLNPEASGYETAISGEYIAMYIGPDRPACITDEVARDRVAFLDAKLREIVEVVGFPAFPPWLASGEDRHVLDWRILNSGIPGATLPAEGGHQGNAWGHMNFESTQTCPCTWDAYQSGGAAHECVHALQSERWIYNNRASGWVHEAHNNYMLTMANALVHGNYTMGSAHLVLQMPHVPIESMGLLQNDMVAGPADQHAGSGANAYIDSQVRYALEIFFLSTAQTMGRGFNNCLWMMPDGNDQSVFQNMEDIAGVEATGRAVLDFGAKSALLDFEEWTETMRSQMRRSWNDNWWFYSFPASGDGTTTFRPPEKTTPHHQGRNVIPIRLNSGATSVTVEFTPDAAGSNGTPLSMLAQLVYRNDADEPIYGEVFSSGQSTIAVPAGAMNDVVNLVVAVTNRSGLAPSDDDSFKGFDGQEHFSYQARIVSGGTLAPRSTRPWPL